MITSRAVFPSLWSVRTFGKTGQARNWLASAPFTSTMELVACLALALQVSFTASCVDCCWSCIHEVKGRWHEVRGRIANAVNHTCWPLCSLHFNSHTLFHAIVSSAAWWRQMLSTNSSRYWPVSPTPSTRISAVIQELNVSRMKTRTVFVASTLCNVTVWHLPPSDQQHCCLLQWFKAW